MFVVGAFLSRDLSCFRIVDVSVKKNLCPSNHLVRSAEDKYLIRVKGHFGCYEGSICLGDVRQIILFVHCFIVRLRDEFLLNT